ncbi:MAG TPA: regulatory iron-sulfur-containing complex subunit RicT [Gemmatimonadales bacterium]
MGTTVEVGFKGIRREFFRWEGEAEPLRLRDPVIVEVERGLDFGRVSAIGEAAAKKCGGCSGCGPDTEAPAEGKPLRPVVRLASQEEIQQANELRRSEEDIRRVVAGKAWGQKLGMRISDAEWQWDRKKLTVYFTAEQRVDFRNLVRDLATQYRTRIELRQIGVRDEAARLGGVGRCGREFCCSTWLKDLSPVSLSLAKDQHLSLNPTQISGGCGRLLCCLRYEHEFYVASRKRFPKEGKTLRTARGAEKVIAVDIFRERVLLRGEEGTRTLALVELRAEMETAPELPLASPAPTQKNQEPASRKQETGNRKPETERKPAVRERPRRPAPEPRTEAAALPAPESVAEATPGASPSKKRRRRRRRRGGGPGAPGDAGPSGSPEA